MQGCGLCPNSHQNIDLGRHQLGDHAPKSLRQFIGKAMFEDDVAPIDVPEVSKTFKQSRVIRPFFISVIADRVLR